MFREEVAEHYRSKGYKLHEHVKVRGQSGSIHAVDMVAQSSLGNLAISFEHDGDFEGPEMGAVRRMARDIGATPVVAVEHMPDGLRQHAARAGVVLLDRAAMEAPSPELAPEFNPAPPEPEQVPWPNADKESRRDDPGIWRYERTRGEPATALEEEAPVPELGAHEAKPASTKATGGFDWLPRESVTVPHEPSPQPPLPPEPEAKTEAMRALKVVAMVLLAGAAAGAAFFGLSLVF